MADSPTGWSPAAFSIRTHQVAIGPSLPITLRGESRGAPSIIAAVSWWELDGSLQGTTFGHFVMRGAH
jgi:hypothetical protein